MPVPEAAVTTTKYGVPSATWDKACTEMTTVLVGVARDRGMIAYSDLVRKVKTIRFRPDESRFHAMLGEISTAEANAGRGMLSVIVVHKIGDMEPGPGFYDLAAQLGRDTTDRTRCWIAELHRVHAVWKP